MLFYNHYLIRCISLCFLSLFLFTGVSAQTLSSPDGNLFLDVCIDEKGTPTYSLEYKGQKVIEKSRLGFRLLPAVFFNDNFEIVGIKEDSADFVWYPVWGENSAIPDCHRELLVELKQQTTGYLLNMRFRLFDDGLGFRYEFPVQPSLRHFLLADELTEFKLTGDHKAFWLPGDYDTNEYAITTSRLSEIPLLIDEVRKAPLVLKSFTPNLAVQTPLMMKSAQGLYINIHEAALDNYAGMCLNVDPESYLLSTHLTPDKNGVRGYIQTGSVTPWRTIVVSDDARDILASNLILNLNEPCKIVDTSWIKPVKYVGVWWDYFVGRRSFTYTDTKDIVIGETDYFALVPHGRHGATTEHAKEYIDFASENGFDAVLVEGWNEGWEDAVEKGEKERIFNFTKAYPDFDVVEVTRYAKSKGVRMIMHHETCSAVSDYERQLHDAFRFMTDHGYNMVKTGYVGPIIPRSEYHDGQWMVNHYNYVARTAADYKIMVNSHEAVRPTGMCRTWPNWLAQESARGTEFESFAWHKGNKPDHTTILPFTRLMGGPMDYTPGILETDINSSVKLSSTLVKQLALYVTMYSPFQMAADLMENYKKYADAFQFIKDVAVDWDHTYILEAEPGDYITIARKAKGKEEWFVGGITDENGRDAVIDFHFLPSGKQYFATVYADGKNADWQTNAKEYTIRTMKVTSKTKLKQRLAPGGGVAISINIVK